MAPRGDARGRTLLEELAELAGAPRASAASLIQLFGSAHAVLSVEPEVLRDCSGDPRFAALLDCTRRLMRHALRSELERRQLLSEASAVVDYLRFSCGVARREEFHILYLDAKNRLLHAEALAGTIDEVQVSIREIIRTALNVGAAGLLVAHNHPSGEASASVADKDLTRRIAAAVRAVGLVLLDHLIIAGSDVTSLRAEGVV